MLILPPRCLRWALGVAAVLGCATTTVSSGEPDAGPAADAALDLASDAPPACSADATLGDACLGDAECDDGCFCNGRERCSGGLCVAAADPCDDGVECTRSVCDEATSRCLAPALDDTRCDDDEPCNGAEACTVAGCVAGTALVCDDGDACTVDTCTPGAGCTFAGFEDPCAPPPGCLTPLPDPPACCFPEEICGNARDDDCDGLLDVDDADCPATNDTCATAQRLPGAGTYRFTTRGAAFDRTSECSVSGSAPLRDVVFRFELTETSDVRAFVEGEGFLELRGAGPESVCLGDFAAARDFFQCFPRVVAHDHLPPGTYWLLYGTRTEGSFDLELGIVPSSPRTCVPEVVPPEGRRFTRRFIGDDADGPGCGSVPGAPDTCYALTLATPRAVRATLRATSGVSDVVGGALEVSGAAVACESAERRPVSVLFGNVPAGTLSFVTEPLEDVATQHELNIEVLDTGVCDVCSAACALAPGGRALLDAGVLGNDAMDIGCPGTVSGPDAFFAFDTTVANERVDFEVSAAADFAYGLRTGTTSCPFASPDVCGAGLAGTPLTDRFRVATPGRHLVAIQTVAGASGTLDVRITPTGLTLPAP